MSRMTSAKSPGGSPCRQQLPQRCPTTRSRAPRPRNASLPSDFRNSDEALHAEKPLPALDDRDARRLRADALADELRQVLKADAPTPATTSSTSRLATALPISQLTTTRQRHDVVRRIHRPGVGLFEEDGEEPAELHDGIVRRRRRRRRGWRRRRRGSAFRASGAAGPSRRRRGSSSLWPLRFYSPCRLRPPWRFRRVYAAVLACVRQLERALARHADGAELRSPCAP